MVSSTHLGTPADVIIPPPSASSESYAKSFTAFQSWSTASHTASPSSPLVIMQLCHTGRQSMRGSGRSIMTASKAPSAVGLNSGKGFLEKTIGKIVWGTPDAMTYKDIALVVDQFVRGARMAREAGFEGGE